MLIPLQVTFRNMPHDAAIEEVVRQEAAKLEQFCDRITSCHVVVERPQRAPSAKLYHVRIDVGLPLHKLVVNHTPTLQANLRDLQLERSRTESDAIREHRNPARVIRETFHEMRRRLQDKVRELDGAVKSLSKLPRAKVKVIFAEEGFGFLETPDAREIYFNKASVLDEGFDRLRAGSSVRFVEEPGENGPQATTVAIAHPRRQARTAAGSEPLQPKAASA